MCYIEVINFDPVNIGDPGSVWILCFSHSTRYYGKTISPRQIKNGVNVSMYVYEVVVLASSD